MSDILKKYQSIDKSKLSDEDKARLEKLAKASQNFLTDNEQKIAVVNTVLDQIISVNPNAVIKPKKAPASAKKHAHSHKSKTPSAKEPKAEDKDNNIMVIAKRIQKQDESWQSAVARAKQILKERKDEQNAKTKSELEKLHELVRTKKELQGFAKSDIYRDAKRDAKPRGARVVTKEGTTSNQYGTFSNKLGRRYWETRDRHADRLAPNYPKDMPRLESGGTINGEISFTQNDAVKLQTSNEPRLFYLDKTSSYWEVKKKPDGKVVGKWYATLSVLKLTRKQDPELVQWLAENNHLTLEQYESYELGGDIQTNLMGGLDGKLESGTDTLLDGYTGTYYDGLVGETGALSTGEMFEKGGEINPKLNNEIVARAQKIALKKFENPTKEEFDQCYDQACIEFGYSPEAVKRKMMEIGEEYPDYDYDEFESGGDVNLANQQVMEDATQHYVDYYLGDVSSQIAYKSGGKIPNNYEGLTDEQIWNNWSYVQRAHFLEDHEDRFKNVKWGLSEKSTYLDIAKSYDYADLPFRVKDALRHHIDDGQYAKGGITDNGELYIQEICNQTGLSKNSLKKYATENNLTSNELLNIGVGIGRRKITRSDVITAIIGTKNNDYSKELIRFAKSDEAMKAELGMDVYNGTEFMDNNNMFSNGGDIDGKLNRKVYQLAIAEGITMDKLGKERYNKTIVQALVESLTDANYHSEAKKVVAKMENQRWSDKLYRSEYYDQTKEVREFADSVAGLCGWSGDDILNAYYYVGKMEGSNIGNLIDELFFKKKDDNYIKHEDIESVTVKLKAKTVTFKGDDVLNGANILEDGGDLSKIANYIPQPDVVSVQLKNGESIKPANGYWIKKGAKPLPASKNSNPKFIISEQFNQGDVVWNKEHDNYGVVMDNYGDPIGGDSGEIRLDSDGNQSIFTYDKKWNRTGYNLVKLGSAEDKGIIDLAQLKKNARSLINQAESSKYLQQNLPYYKAVYKRLLDGEFDAIANSIDTELATNRKLREFDLDTLDKLENAQFEKMHEKMPKHEALQVIINNAEGDYSQLSPELQKIAKEQDSLDDVSDNEVKKNENNESSFVAFYNNKKIEVQAKSLYEAKTKAIAELKVPKSKQGLLAVASQKSMDDEDFRLMEQGGETANKAYSEMREKFDRLDAKLKARIVGAVGLDGAIAFYDTDVSAIHPVQILTKAIISNFITYDEINEKVVDSAMEVAEDHADDEEIGSSDMTYILKEFMQDAGFKVDFVGSRLKRLDDNGNPVVIDNGFLENGGFMNDVIAKDGVFVEVHDIPIDLKDNVSHKQNDPRTQPLNDHMDLSDDSRLRVRPAVNHGSGNPEKFLEINPRAYEYMGDLPKPTSHTHKND